jgi:hypothetical protein
MKKTKRKKSHVSMTKVKSRHFAGAPLQDFMIKTKHSMAAADWGDA